MEEAVRTLGYIVVGYMVVSFGLTGMVVASSDPAGLLIVAAAGAAFAWLVRSYRSGKEEERLRTDVTATVHTVERRLAERADVLAALPPEPFDLAWMVDVAYARRDEPEAQERLRGEYERIRAGAAACVDELDELRADRRSGPTDARLLLAEYDGVDARLDELERSLVELRRARETSLGEHDAPEPPASREPAPQRTFDEMDPLAEAGRRAKEARDEAWAWSLSASAAPSLQALIAQIEAAYRSAVAAAAKVPPAEDPGHAAATAAAIAAFADVERAATLVDGVPLLRGDAPASA